MNPGPVSRQIHTGHRHGGDAFLAANEPQALVGRGLDADLPGIDAQGGGNV